MEFARRSRGQRLASTVSDQMTSNMTLHVKRVIPATLLCLGPIVSAVADVADPARSVPGLPLPRYGSAFADYKPLKDDKPGDWRALNDAVKRDGMSNLPGMAPMPGMGAGDVPEKPGMGKPPGDAMSMPMPKKPVAPAAVRPRAAAAASAAAPADMKGMPGMAGMSGHSDHRDPSMSGGKP